MMLCCLIVLIVCCFNFLGLINFVVFLFNIIFNVFLIFILCFFVLFGDIFLNRDCSWEVIFFIFGGVIIFIFICVVILILIFLLLSWFLCNFLWKIWWVDVLLDFCMLFYWFFVGGNNIFKMWFFVVFCVCIWFFLIVCDFINLIVILVKFLIIDFIFLFM